jgi:hypothetical protein
VEPGGFVARDRDHPGQADERDHGRRGAGNGDQQREHHEQGAGDEQPPAADPVAEPGDQQGQEHRPGERPGEDDPYLAAGESQLPEVQPQGHGVEAEAECTSRLGCDDQAAIPFDRRNPWTHRIILSPSMPGMARVRECGPEVPDEA